ncbi:hypothetical protein [Shimia abyssi]|uniref:Uncharacterized protein n=1 Tax=Shimia abyssi TaxID=1662395 RepID=A0A2P8ESY8_9RHOB|nr:hypothetical protein [Shimia abyssi]PSL12573.1 hypothetical protein CLV88_1391 [Shimia abyssi]
MEDKNNTGPDPRDFVGLHGGTIAKQLVPDLIGSHMAVSVLARSSHSTTLKFLYAGEICVVKHFPVDNPKARASYLRERDALRVHAPSGLVPNLEFFSDEAGFLAVEHIDGENVRDVIDRKSLDHMCFAIGEWLGDFAKAAPFKQVTGNWDRYLHHYRKLHNSFSVRSSSDFLRAFTYDKVVLSKNDGALSNLMVARDGKLFGIDFENSQFKPVGWDLLLSARALVRLFPSETNLCISELANGFCKATGANTEQYRTFLHVAAVGAAFEIGSGTTEKPALTALRTYNEKSDAPAQVVGHAPFLPKRLQEPAPEKVLALFQHLEGLDLGSVPLEEAQPTANEGTPPAEFEALCRGCQGNCCTLAVGQKAFIDAKTAKRAALHINEEAAVEVALNYISYLPEKHVQGSCLFHGPDGCALPRQMRSDICTKYACHAAREMLNRIDTHNPDGVLCLAGEGVDFQHAAHVQNGKISAVPLEMVTREQNHA